MKLAMELSAASAATVVRYENGLLRYMANAGVGDELWRDYVKRPPRPPSRGSIGGRVILERRPVGIEDLKEDREYDSSFYLPQFRRIYSFPLLREGEPVGAINVGWEMPGPIPEKVPLVLQHLRRPGRDRDPERAAVQRNEGSARAADVDGGDPARDQRVDHRHAAGIRRHRAKLPEALRRQGGRPGDAQGRHDGERRLRERRRELGQGRVPGTLAAGSWQWCGDLHPRFARHRCRRHARGREAIFAHAQARAGAGLPLGAVRSVAARGRGHRLPYHPARGHRRVRRKGDFARADLRRPGGHRDRERAIVQRGARAARAARPKRPTRPRARSSRR